LPDNKYIKLSIFDGDNFESSLLTAGNGGVGRAAIAEWLAPVPRGCYKMPVGKSPEEEESQ